MRLFKRIYMLFYNHIFMNVVYRPALQEMGRNVYIGKPRLLTPSALSLGNEVYIWAGCRIEGVTYYEGETFRPRIRFGDHTSVQQNLHLTCAGEISLGCYVAIAANVTISDIIHPYEDIHTPIEKQKIRVQPVSIGDESKIYNNAVILPGTTIGKHCSIGANSVVAGNFPDYCVIVGAPARIVKRYCAESGKWRKTDPKGIFLD